MTQSSFTRCQDRRLPLAGAVNFRDLGGYQAKDGRRVKRGLIFRSDHLSRLTEDDLQLLNDLELKVVCDLRTIQEQNVAPDRLPVEGTIRHFSLPVLANGFDPASVMNRLRTGDHSWLEPEFFIRLYLHYLDDFGSVWGQVLRLATSPKNLPLVFHCTGGKDRTGVCAALLLKTLRVEEEIIIQDHALSNTCNAERLKSIYTEFAAIGIDTDQAAFYLQALSEPLTAMLEQLKQKYGGVEEYLIQKGELDPKTIQGFRDSLLL